MKQKFKIFLSFFLATLLLFSPLVSLAATGGGTTGLSAKGLTCTGDIEKGDEAYIYNAVGDVNWYYGYHILYGLSDYPLEYDRIAAFINYPNSNQAVVYFYCYDAANDYISGYPSLLFRTFDSLFPDIGQASINNLGLNFLDPATQVGILEFETNIPIFDSKTDCDLYLQGVIDCSSAINYNKFFNAADLSYQAADFGFTVSGGGGPSLDLPDFPDIEPIPPYNGQNPLDYIASIFTTFSSNLMAILGYIGGILSSFFNAFMSLLGVVKDNIVGALQTLIELLKDKLAEIKEAILHVFDSFFSSSFATGIFSAVNSIKTILSDLKDFLMNKPDASGFSWDGLTAILKSFFGLEPEQTFGDFLKHIFILLFDPTEYKAEIETAFNTKIPIENPNFAFILDEYQLLIRQIVQREEAPVIELNNFTIGGQEITNLQIDLAFLQPYIGYIRGAIALFIWVTYVYTLFRNLPRIIDGAVLVPTERELEYMREPELMNAIAAGRHERERSHLRTRRMNGR